MNRVTDWYWDRQGSVGYVEINGSRHFLFRAEVAWDEGSCRPVMGFALRVAPDYNMTGRFVLVARTVQALVRKVEAYPDKLV